MHPAPIVAALAALFWASQSPTLAATTTGAHFCAADCDARGDVSVDELIVAVNIALGQTDLAGCFTADADADGEVAINDLVGAVNLALDGCGDERTRQVDARLAPLSDDTKPAAAVLVNQGDRILHRRLYGMANLETRQPATAQHVFPLASVSKMLTSLAVLHLVEQGRLDLDDPVVLHLPELQRFGDAVTIRHLLQHTSGLPDWYTEPLWSALQARTRWPANADGLAILSTQGEALFAPGELWAYLNGGFELLALIVERISAKPFSDFQQELIYDRLAMRSSFSLPRPEREATAPFVQGYVPLTGGRFVPAEIDASYYMYGAGEVVSNIDDLFRFDRGVFGGQIVRRDTLEQALAPAQLNDGSPTSVIFEPDSSYGLGWVVGNHNGHRYVGHAGVYYGLRTYYAHFVDDDLNVVVLLARDYGLLVRSRLVFPIADLYLPPAE